MFLPLALGEGLGERGDPEGSFSLRLARRATQQRGHGALRRRAATAQRGGQLLVGRLRALRRDGSTARAGAEKNGSSDGRNA